MNRIVLPLVFVGAVVLLAGITGFWVVNYVQHQPAPPPPGKTPNLPISYEEMEKLEGKGAQAASEIPRLVACFEVDNEDVRLKAALTLKEIGKKAVGPVSAKLKDKNPKVRFYAVETLGLIGPDAASAAEGVRACLSDANADVRYKAAFALGRFGVATGPVLGSLVDLIDDKDDNVAMHATEALEKIGPPAATFLFTRLATKDEPRRERILAVVVKLGTPPKDALPTLAELSKDPASQAIRGNSLRLLGRLGKDALPAFKDALKKAEPNDDFDLMHAIAELGADGNGLLPEMSVYLSNRTFWDAEPEVMVPYKKSGGDGAKALGALLKTLQTKLGNPLDHREMAVLRTLGEMGADAKPAVPVLIELLKDKQSMRAPILQTLGDIGPAAREATPAVEALRKDPAVGAQAQAALKRMGVIEKK